MTVPDLVPGLHSNRLAAAVVAVLGLLVGVFTSARLGYEPESVARAAPEQPPSPPRPNPQHNFGERAPRAGYQAEDQEYGDHHCHAVPRRDAEDDEGLPARVPASAAEADAQNVQVNIMSAVVVGVASVGVVLVYGARDLSREPRQVLRASGTESGESRTPRVR